MTGSHSTLAEARKRQGVTVGQHTDTMSADASAEIIVGWLRNFAHGKAAFNSANLITAANAIETLAKLAAPTPTESR
jgi:hypothetical protein